MPPPPRRPRSEPWQRSWRVTRSWVRSSSAGPAPAAPRRAAGGAADRPSRGGSQLKTSLFLLSVVAGGGLVGILLPPLGGIDLGTITGRVLNALLFFVGMQFAQSGLSFKAVFLRPDTLMIPVATAIGSLAGGLVLAPLFGLPAGHAMSLTAGFGWYSLSGVLIANLGNPVLGSAAFLANLFRESLAFLTIPLLARTRYPHLAIGAGGATAMDVTLPLIEQCVGPESVPASFASGALLSLSVPILVPFLFGLGA
ncbi:MAG: lysine exporter LysO family protein [Candidatus Moduliflexus flocculans]|nr:lysine exporter LysO family protein [Candidatus Moduliflexus flocculans]